MKILNNKTKIPTLTLILVTTLSSLLFVLPTTSAQTSTHKSYALCVVTPNPIGVHQSVLVLIGMAYPTAYPQPGWYDLTCEVKRPDGETVILGPFDTDLTGATGAEYTPTMVGTYSFRTYFPEQEKNFNDRYSGPPGTIMEESYSDWVDLTVTDDPREFYPEHQLPTEYWTRPIDSQLREWATISGNWLGCVPNSYAAYTEGPETAHVLWAKAVTTGGLAGGEFGYHGFHTGDAYEGLVMVRASPVIINGILYYNHYPSNYPMKELIAVDIRTGEEIWKKEGIRVDFGQIMKYDSRNQHGAFGYLWEVAGSTWNAYSPDSGEWLYTMTNVPVSFFFGSWRADTTRGPSGEIIKYVIDSDAGWMALWNSSALTTLYGAQEATGSSYYQWRPWGKTVDAQAECPVSPDTPLGISGYSWNVSMPTDLPGSIQAILDDRIIGGSITSNLVSTWAISLGSNEYERGELIFSETWVPPEAGDIRVSWAGASSESNSFALRILEHRTYYGFSADTGELIWGPTDPEGQLNVWVGTEPQVAEGKLFSAGYDGVVYCYDMTNGNLLWKSELRDEYTEILWSDNWPIHIGAIADGKVYVYHMEHSAVEPKPRGAPFVAFDIESGELLWEISLRETYWGSDPSLADGIMVILNTYDNRLYSFGKGPTETTVSITNDVTTIGSSVIIKGTVTDISAGTEEDGLHKRFPSGVPAASDEIMTEWMQYVYMQHERPDDFEGVEVFLKILDPNGDYYSAVVTTDENGYFSHMWNPSIVGEYYVTAMFEGSLAYYKSQASAAFGIDEATSYQGPSAGEIAQKTADEIGTEGMPAYLAIDIVIILLVVVAIILAIYGIIKKK
jgi:outer membrane protein assembly factor BamB